jgi:hypothetical protein
VKEHEGKLVFVFAKEDRWLSADHIDDIADVATGSHIVRCQEDVRAIQSDICEFMHTLM